MSDPFKDWSPLVLQAKKHLANCEAAATLGNWVIAEAEARACQECCRELAIWFAEQCHLETTPLGTQA